MAHGAGCVGAGRDAAALGAAVIGEAAEAAAEAADAGGCGVLGVRTVFSSASGSVARCAAAGSSAGM
ncbi:MAG: hypothetical protein LBU72_09050 [Burkholderiaceae bacterium]|nr:hypothetical protein [Burkholderiaceae bacterium]